MKKLFALILALGLLCSVASAEETVINWEDMIPVIEASGLEGDFVLLEDLGLMIWLPEGMESVEVPEDQAAAGRLALFISEDQTAYFAVDAANVEGMTLDAYYTNVQAANVEDVEMVTLNGLNAVTYKDNDTNVWSAVLVDTNSNIINFIMGPASDEGSDMVFGIVMSSLQAVE